MSKQSSSSSGGIGVSGLLGIVFVTLKLCRVIDWSWWWVTAPFWGPVAIALTILAGIGLFMLGAFIVAASASYFTR